MVLLFGVVNNKILHRHLQMFGIRNHRSHHGATLVNKTNHHSLNLLGELTRLLQLRPGETQTNQSLKLGHSHHQHQHSGVNPLMLIIIAVVVVHGAQVPHQLSHQHLTVTMDHGTKKILRKSNHFQQTVNRRRSSLCHKVLAGYQC